MKTLVLTTDFSDSARQAYFAAASLARTHGATIELVHEIEALPVHYSEYLLRSMEVERCNSQLRDHLAAETSHTAFKDVEVVPQLLYREASAGNVVDFARAKQADLIIIATHGRTGLAHVLLGSFAEHVARHSSVPVLSYRQHEPRDDPFELRRILVPLDFSENSKSAFPIIRRLCDGTRVEVHVLHVFPEVSIRGNWGDVQERLRVSAETASKMEEELRAQCLAELPGMDVNVDSRFGDPYAEIIKAARVHSPDLIVMATHGRTGIRRIYFGSIAEKVLRTASCSVLTVRPEEIQEDASVPPRH